MSLYASGKKVFCLLCPSPKPNKPPDATAKKAAQDALNGWDPSYGAIYYFNPNTATSAWIWSRPMTVTIGKHRFFGEVSTQFGWPVRRTPAAGAGSGTSSCGMAKIMVQYVKKLRNEAMIQWCAM